MTTSTDSEAYKQGLKKEWKTASQGWKKWWARIEKGSQPVSDRMVKEAGIAPGHRVLDIATGIGEPALTAARMAGPEGHVLGTDLSPDMLAFARARAKEHGLTNVEFQEADAETMTLPDEGFDAALCRFGLMFMPDAKGTVARIRKCLAPGGKFVATTWGPPENVPMIGLARAALQKVLDLPPPPPDQHSPMTLNTEAELRELFASAGFLDVQVDTVTMTSDFDSPEMYVDFVGDIAVLFRETLAKQTPDKREAVLKAVAEAARAHAGPDGTVSLDNEAFLVTGQR